VRVILDTNILLSAMISDRGAPHMIYRAWRAGRFDLVTSEDQLDELRRASHYPKFKTVLQPHHVGTMINNLRRAMVLKSLPTGIEATDPFDAFLLEMAKVGEADWLVTGDHRAGILERGSFGKTRIATPSQFCTFALNW
jgi:uncharacterized protein